MRKRVAKSGGERKRKATRMRESVRERMCGYVGHPCKPMMNRRLSYTFPVFEGQTHSRGTHLSTNVIAGATYCPNSFIFPVSDSFPHIFISCHNNSVCLWPG